MADEQFYTILTNVGKAKVANAALLNNNVTLKTLKVGDGNGAYYNPTEDQKELRNVVYTCNVGSVSVDKDNPNWIVAETIIPGNIGGFTIREIGLFDVDGDMIAIGKYPETYKPVVANGASKDLNVRTIFEVSNAENVTLSINPSVIIATKEDINNLQVQINEHKKEYTELKEDVEQLSNPNLLINGYFKNPVNQRGQAIYNCITDSGVIYTIDRWHVPNKWDMIVELTSNGLKLTSKTDSRPSTSPHSTFRQFFEYELDDTKVYTLSAKIDGEIHEVSGILYDSNGSAGTCVIRYDNINLYATKNKVELDIISQNDESHLVEWIKLEIGDKATPFCPMKYGLELASCRRFFQYFSLYAMAITATTAVPLNSLHVPMRVAPNAVKDSNKEILACINEGTDKIPVNISMVGIVKGVGCDRIFYIVKDSTNTGSYKDNNFVVGSTYKAQLYLDAEIY